jgi:hypothetical protein
MKKIYLLILVAMLTLPGLNAKSQDFAPSYWQTDSVWYFQWDIPSSAWNHYERELLVWNSNGNLTSDTYYVMNDGTLTWENSFRYRYQYKTSGSTETTWVERWSPTTSEWKTIGYTHYNDDGNIDESYNLVWVEMSQTFTVGGRQLSYFGTNNEKVQLLSQIWDASTQAWKEYLRYSYTYTSTGKPDVTLTEIWNDGILGFENQGKDVYTYNAQDQMVQLTNQVWNTGTSSWDDFMRQTNTYDPFGNLLFKLQELYDLPTSSWVNNYGTDFTYNANNQLTDEFEMKWNTVTLAWDFYTKKTYTYYPGQSMDENSSYTWNPVLLAWMITSNYKYLENGSYASYYNKTIDMSTYTYISGYKYDYTFNTQNHVSLIEGYYLNVLTNGWDPTSQDSYTYDANQHLSEITSTAWNASTMVWDNSFKQQYFGTDNHIGIPELPALSEVCLFQNPLKAGAVVSCPGLEQGKYYTLSLYSISGQQVSQSRITNGETLVIPGNLNTGMYMVSLTGNNGIIARGKVLVIN